jgi:hypothetical protein
LKTPARIKRAAAKAASTAQLSSDNSHGLLEFTAFASTLISILHRTAVAIFDRSFEILASAEVPFASKPRRLKTAATDLS